MLLIDQFSDSTLSVPGQGSSARIGEKLDIMTGADGAAGPDAGPGWRWDVALSFAGAQRPYVEQVAGALKARGLRCFYDADEQIDLWGKYLAEELPAIYGEQAAAVVVFVSAEYAARDWTRLERRAALNRAVRERGEYVLPARFDDTPLPGLLSDLVAVDLRGRTPQQFAAMIADKLARLAITASASSAGAGDLARDVEPAPPAGAVRAGDADPRRLGVHAAISVQGVPDDVLPVYVPRDTDTAENGVRVKVAAAAERGGFVLLVGGSSVGKTRCAVEAVKAVLPEWWLVHPVGPAEIAALARVPVPHTVVWLDELQRYLDGEHGLTGGVVRALLDGPHPVVIIGTLWPDRYAGYTTVPTSGGADPHAREREVLDLAAVVRIGPEFSEAEQGRARAAARRDPRLRVALEAAGYGLTQTLAAAPQLVARWEDAQTASPYGWAVLAAALDAARLGAHSPLSADFLRAAAPGYCTSQQQAEAPGNWFEQALAYAAGKLHGAVAALSPAGAGMGRIAGYTVADYLIQHASRERRYERMPASTWDAILRHLRHLPDAAAAGQTYLDVGWAAYGRQQWQAADDAFRKAMDSGVVLGATGLAVRLGHTGQTQQAADVLRTALSLAPADTDAAGLLEIRAELAWWTGAAGNVQVAFETAKDVWRVTRKIYGEEHEFSLRAGRAVARWTGHLGNTDEALRIALQVQEGCIRALGRDHEVTLTSRFEVAAWSWEDGHRDQAMRLWQDLDADTTRVLGEFSHLTNDTRWNLAAITIASGDIQDGLRLMDSVVAGRIAIYGDDHPRTLAARLELTGETGKAGQVPHALDLATVVTNDSTRFLGADHELTLFGHYQIALWTAVLGDTDQAKALFSTLLTGSDRILGPDHELTRDIRGQLQQAPGQTIHYHLPASW